MIIYAHKPGQMGNMLFLFAHFYAFHRKYNIPVFFPDFYPYAHYFEGSSKTLLLHKNVSIKCTWINKGMYFFFNLLGRILYRLPIKFPWVRSILIDWNEVENIEEEPFISLCKHTKVLILRGWKYRVSPSTFSLFTKDLRQFFSIRESFVRETSERINALKKQCTLIGIHIRRGDYKCFEKGRYYYEIGDYIRWMLRLREITTHLNPFFIVCSNERLEKTIFKDFEPHLYLSDLEAIQDLFLLSRCDYIAGPPSTFSMWASFYGNTPLYMIKNIKEMPKSLEEFKVMNYVT